MSKVLIEEQALHDIGDAIRTRNGLSTTYKPGEMPDAIEGISGGTLAETGALSNIDSSIDISYYNLVKYGPIVCLTMYGSSTNGTNFPSATVIATIPEGFRPINHVKYLRGGGGGFTNEADFTVYDDGRISMSSYSSRYFYLHTSWLTADVIHRIAYDSAVIDDSAAIDSCTVTGGIGTFDNLAVLDVSFKTRYGIRSSWYNGVFTIPQELVPSNNPFYPTIYSADISSNYASKYRDTSSTSGDGSINVYFNASDYTYTFRMTAAWQLQ